MQQNPHTKLWIYTYDELMFTTYIFSAYHLPVTCMIKYRYSLLCLKTEFLK